MEDSLSTNNLVRVVVSVLLAVIMVGVVMMPIISDMAEDKEVTNTLTNTGSPFALANADSESHPIIMSVDGDKLIVTSDGSPVSTGLGNVLPTFIETPSGPFNTYYVAVNIATGDNADDEQEERLSKVNGEIAYILNPDNLHQTIGGYTFSPRLYNIFLVIPPVYWYSELDSGSTETGKLYMASSPDAFVSMGITADKLKDYAHTYTNNGVIGHSPAIMIGVYESVEQDSYIRSFGDSTIPYTAIVGRSLTTILSDLDTDYSDVEMGTYQLWNFYQWNLWRMMGWTVMGNMDSQYMMGEGYTSGSSSSINSPGQTDSAYQKAPDNTSSVSLFIENGWGNKNEWIGDTFTQVDQLYVGNTLGGVPSSDDVVNTLSIPAELLTTTSTVSYGTFNPDSEVFGIIATRGTHSAGEGINDGFKGVSSSYQNICGVVVGGQYNSGTGAGSSYWDNSNTWTYSSAGLSCRLAYVITDTSFVPMATKDYAYIMSYNVNGTIQNVQSIENGTPTSYMPNGTTLNTYWDFNTTYSIVYPQLSEATNSVNLAVGSDSILQFYNSGNVVLQTANGTVDLGRVNEVTPTPVTVTVQNGVMSYTKADSTTDTANILLYRANEGDYVYGQNVKLLNDLSQGNVYVGQYQYGVVTDNGTKDIGAIGTFTSQTETVGEGDDAKEVTTVVPDIALFNTANVSTSTVTSSITQGQYYATINSISIATEFSDSDSVDYTVTGFYAPKTQTYVTIETGGGLAYDILLYLPVLILVSVIAFIGYATLRPDSDFIKSLKSRF